MANKFVKQNVVIDTNVIVSAFLSSLSDVATVKVLKKLYNNELVLFYSYDVLVEYTDVLNRDKFKFDKQEIKRFLDFVKKKGVLIIPNKINEELIDEKDMPFYEIVMDKQVDNSKLITGNLKHFPIKPFIMTPAEFIREIEGGN